MTSVDGTQYTYNHAGVLLSLARIGEAYVILVDLLVAPRNWGLEPLLLRLVQQSYLRVLGELTDAEWFV